MDIFEDENLINLIKSVGYLGLFAIVFAESGLLIGFFLPGDSLLFTAGFLSSQGYLNIFWLILILLSAAIIGDNVGYSFGKNIGSKLFEKKNSFFFNKNNLVRAENFYKKYGPMTIIMARFIPVIRTFAPIVAGIGKMNYRIFFIYNVVGGVLWTFLLTLSGYFLPKLIPDIEKNLELTILLIIVLSFLPPVFHFLKEKWSVKQV